MSLITNCIPPPPNPEYYDIKTIIKYVDRKGWLHDTIEQAVAHNIQSLKLDELNKIIANKR